MVPSAACEDADVLLCDARGPGVVGGRVFKLRSGWRPGLRCLPRYEGMGPMAAREAIDQTIRGSGGGIGRVALARRRIVRCGVPVVVRGLERRTFDGERAADRPPR